MLPKYINLKIKTDPETMLYTLGLTYLESNYSPFGTNINIPGFQITKNIMLINILRKLKIEPLVLGSYFGLVYSNQFIL